MDVQAVAVPTQEAMTPPTELGMTPDLTGSSEGAPSVRLINVAEFNRLVESGFFAPDEHVELMEGLLVKMSPNSPLHRTTIYRLARALEQCIGERALVFTQSPVDLPAPRTQPEPDIVIAKLSGDEYMTRHPRPADLLLVVEVSNTSLAYDRNNKQRAYAGAGIHEYWIVNLNDQILEVHAEPQMTSGGAIYRSKRTLSSEDEIAPIAFPECRVALKNIFP